MADIIKGKLVAWKVNFLFVTGKVQLVRSVIQSMTIYSIMVYSWSVSLIKMMEGWCRNFIWSDDIYKRNLVIMTWKHCCRDVRDGGLSIRSLRILNKASDLKQCWSVLNDHEDWARILRIRVFKRGRHVKYHVFSSIWTGSKAYQEVVKNN